MYTGTLPHSPITRARVHTCGHCLLQSPTQAIGKAVFKNKNLLINFSLNTYPPEGPKHSTRDKSGTSGAPQSHKSGPAGATQPHRSGPMPWKQPTSTSPQPEPPQRPTLDTEVSLRVHLAAAELSSAGAVMSVWVRLGLFVDTVKGQKEHAGLLNGVFGVSNIAFVGTALLPGNETETDSPHNATERTRKTKTYPCLNALTLSVENMVVQHSHIPRGCIALTHSHILTPYPTASIKYHSNPILILDVSDLNLEIKDHWAWRTSVGATSAIANSAQRFFARGVDLDIDSNYIYVIMSKETLPSFANVAKKIQRLMQEQVSRFAGTKGAGARKDAMLSELHMPSSLAKAKDKVNALLPLLNGTVSIGGEEILVACFWHSFMDPSWALFHLRAYEMNLVQRMNGKFANRRCDITLGDPGAYSLSVRQMYGPVGTAKVYNLDIEEWIDRVVEAQSTHRIIHAGQMHMRLRSHHNLMSPIIQVKMVTEFPDSIEVSVDVSMYLWIKQLVNLYIDEAKQRRMDRHPTTGDRRESENSLYEDAVNVSTGTGLDPLGIDDLYLSPLGQHRVSKFDTTPIDSDAEPPTEDTVNGDATASDVINAEPVDGNGNVQQSELEATDTHDDKMLYETLQFVLNPELTIASYRGSNFAPPDIEWLLSKLGFKNSRLTIPKEIHEILVDNLVKILNLYASQTSDHEVLVVMRDDTNPSGTAQ
ncbi:hypothetical protein SARC_00528 [Sphaeroforma arctica JP610]|uniref:Bridge-like lipid transfer protein family member 1 C-terminal domain-containing protein n=1 Tax=Sphaeroforma arctica JP610 TaxID=667725 RepID=A0A0L0GE86_9EUKA|nr:hypothetical protein SARC_00528 [Sphaeroforma arctica JP610]KNC87337.1 hypothetical protein SARC_00528 [Sphaeroforma arctica JP610]|eukprot:XP_014161239.1 hypothetical protein SARC_00528 [Sphaeroforma arctica JP610]